MYITSDEIKQLKNDLMSTTNQRTTVYKTFLSYNNISSERNAINSIEGKIFENNVIKTLEIEYNWEKSSYPRHFFIGKFILMDARIF